MQKDENELDNEHSKAELITVRRGDAVPSGPDEMQTEEDFPEENSAAEPEIATDLESSEEAEFVVPEPTERQDAVPVPTDTEPPTTPTTTTTIPGDAQADTHTEVEIRQPALITDHAQSGKKKKWLLISGIIAVVTVVLLGAAWWLLRDNQGTDSSSVHDQSATVYPQGAAITSIDGTVEVNTSDGWTAASSGTNLSQGDQIRTAANSRAVVTLDEGSAVRLDASSVVAFTTLNVGDVTIDNLSGRVYTRVVPSESRTFVVTVDTAPYRAMGTAYMTLNESKKKGVEVYESTVTTKDSSGADQEVKQGEAFYSEDGDSSSEDKITKLDVDKLKENTFLKWNKQQDEKTEEFAKKLGVLTDIDKPSTNKDDEEKEESSESESPSTSEPTPTTGISAWGTKTDSGIKVSWSVSGVNTDKGFKVSYSSTDTTPSYGENSAQYVAAGSSSVKLGLKDGKTWHIRVCAYRGDGKCDSYSNTVSVTAPYVEQAKVTRGTMSVSRNGNTLSWSYTGKAIYGYKVVWNTSGEPTYPTSGEQSGAKYLSSKYSSSLNLAEVISKPGQYYVRVCAYTNGTQPEACVDYGSAPGTFHVD